MTSHYSFGQKLIAEFIGTTFLLTTVVGSGIMAEALAGGNIAIALLGNTIATGAILFVLITIFSPISGAHFNPAVTVVFALSEEIAIPAAMRYILCQLAGAVVGVWIAHVMFAEPLLQVSQKMRHGPAQIFSEGIATFGLIVTILAALKADKRAVPVAVSLYITAAYWFTASTSFANPAVTIARTLSDSFAGIRYLDVVPFIAVQMVSATLAWAYCRWQLTSISFSECRNDY